jgi:uncharacterized membrane protein YbhN (UPF0104 family)
MKRILSAAFILLVFTGSAWLLYEEVYRYGVGEIRSSLAQIPASRLALAAALTILNYLILVGYDWLAVRAIDRRLPLWKTALVSFVGHASSFNFGPLLGGTSVRARLYSAWGLQAGEIVRLITMLVLTLWLGMFALAGLVFILTPLPIGRDLNLPFNSLEPVGVILLTLVGGYLALTALIGTPIHIRGFVLSLPRPGVAILQMIVAAADLVVGALVFYMLLPEGTGVSFPQMLVAFLVAMIAVIFTQVPGGVGVFELAILTLTASESPKGVAAALLAFRVIYYLLPLVVAVSLFIWHEARLKRST